MNQKLQPSTIIPSEFYVERAADRQLREIILGMGRPGYVLVARQMGKTNLLLNSRRELETADLLFVYIDLSNRVGSLEAYFGLVLATAFSVHPRLKELSSIGQVDLERVSIFEFESVLRKVLHFFPGRLVFILDEIDSLAAYPFSDRVFAQIRSMYFSRANFPEYSRVTYVLSGVAEPTDLIKDKNISPFNIGEKIYLSDFTPNEYGLFLEKAELDLPGDVRDRIFHWTRGNPRMTWDVCAEIERALGSNEKLDSRFVDALVNRLYLATFDRPPVDHIRTLAETDREIRAAVRSIRANDMANVSDRVKNKLYLAGITNFQTSDKDGIAPAIKNPIVDEALSEKWLHDLEKDSQSLLIQARISFDQKLYQAAIVSYEQYLQGHDLDRASGDAYRLGISYFRLQKHAKAAEWFSTFLANSSDSDDVRGRASQLLARSQLLLGALDDAIPNLRTGIELGGKSTAAFCKALLASTLFQLDREANAEEVGRLSKEVLNEVLVGDSEEAATIRVQALTNLAILEEDRRNSERALEFVEAALREKSPGNKPTLLIRAIKLLSGGSRKEEMLDELTPSVLALRSTPADERADAALRLIVLPAMMYLGLNGRKDDFEKLLVFLKDAGEFESSEFPKVFEELYDLTAEYGEKGGEIFLHDLIRRYSNVQAAQQNVFSALRVLILVEDFTFSNRYLEHLVRKESLGWLIPTDLIALGFILSRQRANKPPVDVLDHAVAIARENISDRGINYAFLSFYEMSRLEELGRVDKAVSIAQELVELLDSRNVALSTWSQRSKETMLEAAKAVIDRYSAPVSMRNAYRSLGRNTKVRVKYQDGRRVQAKFKQVQQDVALGRCDIEAVLND